MRVAAQRSAEDATSGTASAPGLDPATRQAVQRRIRWLVSAYGLDWLQEQACWPGRRLSELDDSELLGLLHDAEAAREYRLEGVGWDEAGLVRAVRP